MFVSEKTHKYNHFLIETNELIKLNMLWCDRTRYSARKLKILRLCVTFIQYSILVK